MCASMSSAAVKGGAAGFHVPDPDPGQAYQEIAATRTIEAATAAHLHRGIRCAIGTEVAASNSARIFLRSECGALSQRPLRWRIERSDSFVSRALASSR